jgi:DNA-binding NarL/FixJ family response regulator
MPSVLIVEDHVSFADVLELVLLQEDDLDVVGKVHDGEAAVEAAARLRPDVVLMDLFLPKLDGFAATRRILAARPETRVLVLSGSCLDEDRAAATAAGAAGYVVKGDVAAGLVPHLRRVVPSGESSHEEGHEGRRAAASGVDRHERDGHLRRAASDPHAQREVSPRA